MNKDRRKRLEEIIDKLGELKEELDCLSEEEQEAFDNLPESIQYSERGNTMYDNVSDIESASADVEELIDSLQEVVER